MEIRKLNPEEFYELRDLLESVFSAKNKTNTDFATLFPRFFAKPNQYCTDSHLGAFIDGKLVGTAAFYPADYVVGEKHIKLIANGNIAVYEDYRGQGIMTKLINETHRIYDQMGDFGYLHGSSVRYGRFGYIENGVQYTCTLEPEKICGYEFLPMQKNEVEWHQSILVNKTDYINRTPEDFIPALSSQGRKALSVFKNGNLAGFISLSYEQGFIEEFCFADEIEKEVFKAIAHTLQRDVSVRLSGYDIKTLSRLKEFSDVKTSVPALFRIINDKPLKEAAASLGLEENVLYAPYFT